MGILNFIHNLNSPLPYQLIFTNPRDWDVLIFVCGGAHYSALPSNSSITVGFALYKGVILILCSQGWNPERQRNDSSHLLRADQLSAQRWSPP